MAIAPSNNLLNALSQLQGSRPGISAGGAASNTAGAPSFAAQLSRVAAPSQTGASSQAGGAQAPVQTAPPPADASQSRPRSRHLGQYVNILV